MLHTTRLSLFQRIGRVPGDPGVWGEFVALYAPAVLRWCRGHGLQESDAEDVCQDVLVRFWRHAEKFRYDPSRRFRAYLRRIVLSAVADWSESRRPDQLPQDDPAIERLLHSVPARHDLAARIEEAFDMERFAIAMEEVRGRVNGRTWEAFRLLALEHETGAAVAARLDMTTNHVYVARFTVQKLIREAIERVDGPLTAACGPPANG